MVQTEAQYKFCYSGVLSGIRRELEKFKGAMATKVRRCATCTVGHLI
jgi:hypothetical protein